MFTGTVLAGAGFKAVTGSALRLLLPPAAPHERAGTLAASYVLSYLAMSVPAVLAGLLTRLYGLSAAVSPYGGTVILLGLAAVLDPPALRDGPPLADRLRPPHAVSCRTLSQPARKDSPLNTNTAPAAVPAWSLGDIVVRRVDEIDLPPQTGPWLLPLATKEVLDEASWLRPHFADAEVPRLASHSFAVEAGGLRIVVDTGIGNAKTRANAAWNQLDTDFLDRLTAAGFAPESVDLVVTTHLHTDHVGWNTRLDGGRWIPTFPNARYLTSRTEWDYWAATEMEEARLQMFRDSVHPVRDNGQYDLVDVPDHGREIAPGVRLAPAPGHTPGQVAVELRGGDRRALITGDSIHHPVQLSHPHIGSCVDIDSAQALRTRHRILDGLADSDTLLLGTHFPQPTAGTVRSENGRYRLLTEAAAASV